MRKGIYLLLISCLFLLLTSCTSSGSGKATAKFDYEETKKMFVDILKTDEGKKAIRDIMEDEKMKEQLIMDQTIVKETIEKTLTSEKGLEFWKKASKIRNLPNRLRRA